MPFDSQDTAWWDAPSVPDADEAEMDEQDRCERPGCGNRMEGSSGYCREDWARERAEAPISGRCDCE